MPISVNSLSHHKGGATSLMVSYSNVLCLLEGVKTDMKPVGFQEDQIPILMKMKIMKGRDEKEVRELFVSLFYTVTLAVQKTYLRAGRWQPNSLWKAHFLH